MTKMIFIRINMDEGVSRKDAEFIWSTRPKFISAKSLDPIHIRHCAKKFVEGEITL